MEGLHLSSSRRGREPRLLPKTRLSGRRCRAAPAPAEAERRAGTDWEARGDAEQPPDAATAPLRALAPEAQHKSCRHPPCPTPRSRGRLGSARRERGNGPCASGWSWCAGSLPRAAERGRRAASPATRVKLRERLHLMQVERGSG